VRNCTSRNCSVVAGLDDMMLPTKYAGNVILNLMTYPIRINNKKYISHEDGHHLTWEEVKAGVPHEVKVFDSGPGYDDQREITWEELTEKSGSPELIVSMTSVTKLPRRVFTYSKKNLLQAIRHNDTGHKMFLSVNFTDYVDHSVKGKRTEEDVTDKIKDWMNDNLWGICEHTRAIVLCLGTGPLTDDTIQLWE